MEERLKWLVGSPSDSVFKMDAQGREASNTALRLQREPIPEDVQKNVGKEMQADLDQTGEKWKGYNAELARGVEENTALGFKLEEIHIKFNQANGVLSSHQAAMAMAALHTKLYKNELTDLDEQISL